MIRIYNWSITTWSQDPFQAPECQEICLQGNVNTHSRFPKGQFIKTSPIVSVVKGIEGTIVQTESGSIYLVEFANVDPNYLEWCRKNNIEPPTTDNPIRIKSRT